MLRGSLSKKKERLAGITRAPSFWIRLFRRNLVRLCHRFLRGGTPNGLLGGGLLLREVLFLHFGLVPRQEERGFRIVGGQCASEVDGAALFNARRGRLADDLHIHVGGRGCLEFRVTGYKRHF